MSGVKKVKKMVFTAAISGALLLVVGCGWKPNEEQINQMEETRAAALSAEQKVEELKQQKQQLQGQLTSAQQEADKVCADKDATAERVQNWQGSEGM